MNYQDQVVVLTGASGGIGSAMTKKFTDLGAKVALLDITVDRVQALADKLGLGRDRAFCAAVDVSNEESVKATVDAIVKHFGRIDVLVNAAGIPGPSARVEDYSFSDAKKVLSVNLFGTFLMMHTVLPVMQAQKHGAILNFGSVSGVVGYPFESAYGASKAAIIHLTKNAASENGGNGVRINAISPGWVKTNMMATILDSYKNVGFDNADENVTLGRWADRHAGGDRERRGLPLLRGSFLCQWLELPGRRRHDAGLIGGRSNGSTE